ncbi:MAG: GNAT family N-acetyltransferase [Lachnospiraceae bacterium]|nr:GNAT family N-acetyltransferase [Lachnospiraceae bacterium]
MIQRVTDTRTVAHLFGDWQESLIWSALSGTMGAVYAKDTQHPVSAMAALGDFIFLAGEPDEELVRYRPVQCKPDFVIIVPQEERWNTVIEDCYGAKAKKVSRYAIKTEKDIFDKEKLTGVISTLPEGYELKLIDEALYHTCLEEDWSRDFVVNYKEYADYERLGLGACILKDGELLSGASSYSGYPGGIEIEIGTRKDYRRKGLAYICGAKLILSCLERGWYPKWDAQNLWSVALAEKLGYHYSHDYTAYEIHG